jgi:hypothetical protein
MSVEKRDDRWRARYRGPDGRERNKSFRRKLDTDIRQTVYVFLAVCQYAIRTGRLRAHPGGPAEAAASEGCPGARDPQSP